MPGYYAITLLLNASRNNALSDRGGELSIVGNNRVTGRFNADGTGSNPQAYDLFYVIEFDGRSRPSAPGAAARSPPAQT